MNLYLDCEFNGFGGDLISMALVAENGIEWYEVLNCHYPNKWVADNVMPKLNKNPIVHRDFKGSLCDFLEQFDRIHVIADWPEDISHFCNTLIIKSGLRMRTPPLTIEIVRVELMPNNSQNPHNALEDARGLKRTLTGSL
tara:strand:+ start:1892 stop:2311 length:420 start_codon:yes stop_codon:yes gene_type:complete